MGRSSQRKGKRGEEELAEIFSDNGYPVIRGESQNYGTQPDISGLAGIHVEVKRNERLNIYEAVEQAETDSEKFGDGMPTVFHRKNRKQWLVTMRLTDWLKEQLTGMNT